MTDEYSPTRELIEMHSMSEPTNIINNGFDVCVLTNKIKKLTYTMYFIALTLLFLMVIFTVQTYILYSAFTSVSSQLSSYVLHVKIEL